jgi:hypothetical protein
MNEDFLNKVKLSKESIDWWMDESVQTAFEAEEIWFLYEMGELTEEELLVKTKALDDRILYLMAKGGFENKNLFEIFTKEIKNEEKPK